jgi:low affinity Fe/Cu permease
MRMKRFFEKITSIAIAILGNSITFLVALCITIYWIGNINYTQGVRSAIGDIILGIIFLSAFIIQKSFNQFSALFHLKMNELLSHASANNISKSEEPDKINKSSEDFRRGGLSNKLEKSIAKPIIFFTD